MNYKQKKEAISYKFEFGKNLEKEEKNKIYDK